MALVDLALVQHVALTSFDVNTIKVLLRTGGECEWIPSQVKPETIALIEHMIDRKIVERIEASPGRFRLRLTEGIGRACATQILAMDKQAAQAPVHRT